MPHVARGVHGGIVGHEAVTLDAVGGEAVNGLVRFLGERWLAVTGDGTRLPAGTVNVATGDAEAAVQEAEGANRAAILV